MARELRQFPSTFERLRFFIGDVRDTSRLELAMREIDWWCMRGAENRADRRMQSVRMNSDQCAWRAFWVGQLPFDPAWPNMLRL